MKTDFTPEAAAEQMLRTLETVGVPASAASLSKLLSDAGVQPQGLDDVLLCISKRRFDLAVQLAVRVPLRLSQRRRVLAGLIRTADASIIRDLPARLLPQFGPKLFLAVLADCGASHPLEAASVCYWLSPSSFSFRSFGAESDLRSAAQRVLNEIDSGTPLLSADQVDTVSSFTAAWRRWLEPSSE